MNGFYAWRSSEPLNVAAFPAFAGGIRSPLARRLEMQHKALAVLLWIPAFAGTTKGEAATTATALCAIQAAPQTRDAVYLTQSSK